MYLTGSRWTSGWLQGRRLVSGQYPGPVCSITDWVPPSIRRQPSWGFRDDSKTRELSWCQLCDSTGGWKTWVVRIPTLSSRFSLCRHPVAATIIVYSWASDNETRRHTALRVNQYLLDNDWIRFIMQNVQPNSVLITCNIIITWKLYCYMIIMRALLTLAN